MFQRRWTSEKIISHILAREGVEPLNSHYYATTYPDVYAALPILQAFLEKRKPNFR